MPRWGWIGKAAGKEDGAYGFARGSRGARLRYRREMYGQVEQKRENEGIKYAEGATMELARSAVIESWLSIQ